MSGTNWKPYPFRGEVVRPERSTGMERSQDVPPTAHCSSARCLAGHALISSVAALCWIEDVDRNLPKASLSRRRPIQVPRLQSHARRHDRAWSCHLASLRSVEACKVGRWPWQCRPGQRRAHVASARVREVFVLTGVACMGCRLCSQPTSPKVAKNLIVSLCRPLFASPPHTVCKPLVRHEVA